MLKIGAETLTASDCYTESLRADIESHEIDRTAIEKRDSRVGCIHIDLLSAGPRELGR